MPAVVIHSILSLIFSFFFFGIVVPRDLFPPSAQKPQLFSKRNLIICSLALLYTAAASYAGFHLISEEKQAFEILVILFPIHLILALLLYLSITDFLTMEVPLAPTAILLGAALAVNFIPMLLYGTTDVTLWDNHTFSPSSNLVTGLVAGSVISGIVFFTGQKGMGSADIIFASVLGFVNGFPKSILGVYIAIFSALAFGLTLSLKIKTFRNLRIPFIPFLSLGTICSFLLGDSAISILMTLLPTV